MRNGTARDIEHRYLVRPGAADHQLLERLLTPNLWQQTPVALDGIVLDASHAERFDASAREKLLKAGSQVMVDHQVYRLQHASSTEFASLMSLPYAREQEYEPDYFRSPDAVQRFVQSALDFQHELKVTDYLAPAFFVDSKDSAWRDVNEDLLRESIRQAGGQVYATICGSLSAVSDGAFVARITKSGAIGAYVMVSPLRATRDPVSKLVQYVQLLESIHETSLSVVAARQPGFGLALLALGIAGFDSGIAQAEQFNYPYLVRRRTPSKRGQRQGRSLRVYLANLISSVPVGVARFILSTPGLRASFSCDQVCCRDSVTDAIVHNRDHILWSRLHELKQLRDVHRPWRVRHYMERVSYAHQLGDKVRKMLPNGEGPRFTHLDTWSRVVETVAAARQAGRP